MTAFLFIPSAAGAARRVDFADIANLFVETEQPARRPGRAPATRIALAILILLGVAGDMMLVTRADTLASCFASGHSARPATTAIRSS